MKASTARSSFFTRWKRTPVVRPLDPADMGDAFGLDLSLARMAEEGRLPARPAPARRRGFGWMLGLRRRRA